MPRHFDTTSRSEPAQRPGPLPESRGIAPRRLVDRDQHLVFHPALLACHSAVLSSWQDEWACSSTGVYRWRQAVAEPCTPGSIVVVSAGTCQPI